MSKNFDDLDGLKENLNFEYRNLVELELIIDCLSPDLKSRPFAKDLYRFWTGLKENEMMNQQMEPDDFKVEEEEEEESSDDLSDTFQSIQLKSNQIQQQISDQMDFIESHSMKISSSTQILSSNKPKASLAKPFSPLSRKRSEPKEKKEEVTREREEIKEKKKIQPKEKIFDQKSTKKSISSSFKKGFIPQYSTSSMKLPTISPSIIKSLILDSQNKEIIISASFDYLCFTAASEFQDDLKFKQWKEFLSQLKSIIEENKLSKSLQTQYQTIAKIMELKFKEDIIEKLTKISKSKKIVIKKSFGFNIFTQKISPIFRKLKLKDSEKEELSEKQF
jgi:hypothetical protein